MPPPASTQTPQARAGWIHCGPGSPVISLSVRLLRSPSLQIWAVTPPSCACMREGLLGLEDDGVGSHLNFIS